MLAVFTFLSALLWGTFIGASAQCGSPRGRIRLPKGNAIIGNMLFTLPAVSMLFLAPASPGMLIVAAALAVAGLAVGIYVGRTTYWID